MSSEAVREPIEGDGYAVASLDGIGEGYGFRKIRKELGVSEFGVNAVVIPPGYPGRRHSHERQQELYFVHQGNIEIEFGDGSSYRLGPGGIARIDASTVRMVRNIGKEDAIYVAVGAESGYVGRDGIAPDSDDAPSGPERAVR
jgi:uncharacterized cupin superfamily protein